MRRWRLSGLDMYMLGLRLYIMHDLIRCPWLAKRRNPDPTPLVSPLCAGPERVVDDKTEVRCDCVQRQPSILRHHMTPVHSAVVWDQLEDESLLPLLAVLRLEDVQRFGICC